MGGLFGIISGKESITNDLFYGTDYNTHLEGRYGGLAFLNGKIIHRLDAPFRSKFNDGNVLAKYKEATSGIGVISAREPQPVRCSSQHGKIIVCTNGRIYNKEELAEERFKEGWSLTETSDDDVINSTDLAGKIVAKESTIEKGIEKLFDVMEGSLSLLILTNEGIYAARARYGHSPLIIGKKNNTWAVTGETCAFTLGYTPVKELKPGEIMLITKDGPKPLREGADVNQICSFLWIYTSFPVCDIEGRNVELIRYDCGAAFVGKDMENKEFKPDLVAGVPNSGLAHAIGYSIESKIPYMRVFVKYPSYGRSYTGITKQERDETAEKKLMTIAAVAKGKKIVLCDDSIVRGTQLKNRTIKKLDEAGVEEVHLRIACPPLMYPCKFGRSTRDIEELAARKAIEKREKTLEPEQAVLEKYIDPNSFEYEQMVKLIMQDLNITSEGYHHNKVKSLVYLRLDDMIKAIGLQKKDLCTYCWTGEEI